MQKKVFVRIFHEKESCYIEYIGYYDDEKYYVNRRTWHKNDGTYIRDWLPDEYLKCNPNDLRTIYYLDDNDDTISEECHCIEHRTYKVKLDKYLLSPISLMRTFNYQEQQFVDMPKDNRFWVMPEEYDDWKYGTEKEAKRAPED